MKKMEREIISNEEFDLISDYVKIRLSSKVTQRELAEKTGFAQSTIARMEKNLHSATLSTFIKLLNELGYELKIVKK